MTRFHGADCVLRIPIVGRYTPDEVGEADALLEGRRRIRKRVLCLTSITSKTCRSRSLEAECHPFLAGRDAERRIVSIHCFGEQPVELCVRMSGIVMERDNMFRFDERS